MGNVAADIDTQAEALTALVWQAQLELRFLVSSKMEVFLLAVQFDSKLTDWLVNEKQHHLEQLEKKRYYFKPKLLVKEFSILWLLEGSFWNGFLWWWGWGLGFIVWRFDCVLNLAIMLATSFHRRSRPSLLALIDMSLCLRSTVLRACWRRFLTKWLT